MLWRPPFIFANFTRFLSEGDVGEVDSLFLSFAGDVGDREEAFEENCEA